ncbi:probable methyltransferase PMT16 [Vigna angularis]|uniref:probable methyltransferase PMT16 n=1 Tax=Phaseolus angularis TaxID=3914 RepID=UPI0022B2B63E|nr:probable methyltransferase PMT16 [Vigna angularis]
MVFSSLRFLGGFAAALIDDPLWVMNTVPIEAEFNTLGVIYERGLIGTYQNWFMADPSTPTRPQSEDQSQSSTQPSVDERLG